MKNGIVAIVLALMISISAFGQSDFETVFGDRPSGPRDQSMVRQQMVYDAQKARFAGLVDTEFDVESLLLFEQVGLGNPVVWKQTDGKAYTAFPEARYFKVIYMPVDTATKFPGVVWRTWHLDSVAKGFCVLEINPNFPGSVLAKNEKNCSEEMQALQEVKPQEIFRF